MKTPLPLRLLVAASIYNWTVSATCYNPDGSAITNPAFQPCNQVIGVISMCCGTNWTGGKVEPDTCEPNGLCLNSYQNAPLLWRGSCTDPTWKSPNCLSNLCTTYSENGDPTTNVALTDCGNNVWCCQGGNDTCCEEKLGVSIAATIGVSSTSSFTLSSLTSTATKSSGATSITTSPDSGTSATPTTSLQPQSGGLSSGAKIGIAVGVILGTLLVAAAIGFYIYTKRRRNTTGTASHASDVGVGAQELYVSEAPQELPEKNEPGGFQHELQGDHPPIAELAAARYSRGIPPDRHRSSRR